MKDISAKRHAQPIYVALAMSLLIGMHSGAAAYAAEMSDLPFKIASWPAELGSHRVVIHVTTAAPAIRAHLPWRRRDRDCASKAVVVIDAKTGKTVQNVVCVRIERLSGDVVFEPTSGAGIYYVYYLPHRLGKDWGSYSGGYLPISDTADSSWITWNHLSADSLKTADWQKLPAATAAELDARTAYESAYPMEVISSDQEIQELLENFSNDYFVFPEDRQYPIRMLDEIPYKWAKSGPGNEYSGVACRNEYFEYQLGVWAPRRDLKNLRLRFGDLRAMGGAIIPASAMHCINFGGTDRFGNPFSKTVNVAKGAVQPLWLGVQIPHEAQVGDYRGTVIIYADDASTSTIEIKIHVQPKVLEDEGDGDLWRQARLRWLDSTAGINETVTEPYTPLEVSGQTVRCLGRSISFGANGLPVDIAAGSQKILSAPMRFAVATSGGDVEFHGSKPEVVHATPGTVIWESKANGRGLSLSTRATMEFDGHVQYKLTLKSDQTADLENIRLSLPISRRSATYLMGMGHRGGLCPEKFEWHWNGPFNNIWIGDVNAGVECKFLGADYVGPMLNLYHPAPPTSWGNSGHGGVKLSTSSNGDTLVEAYTGPWLIHAGESVDFEFSLLITPVKRLDPKEHFDLRYYHDQKDPMPPAEALLAGVNVVNVHHANSVNPYINYPFATIDRMKSFVDTLHSKNVKVKIYYTIRELSSCLPEIFALRSLGTEIYPSGGGGGYPWLREHLVSGYTAQWYSPYPDGTADASILDNGESRWCNYYVEGLAWLVKNAQIDGLYLDDVAYDRRILMRMRRVMDQNRRGCLIDLHSNTAFSAGSTIQYMEFFPFINRIWFGESFNYDAMSPDQWLVETSGIPFGLMGDMLQGGGNPWRGPVYGMTNRLAWETDGLVCDPRPTWKVWDAFKIADATMIGYWDRNCPVKTNRNDVFATAYVRKGKTLIAVASWAPTKVNFKLAINWSALGIDPAKASFYAPPIEGIQSEHLWHPDDEITIRPTRGWQILVDQEVPNLPIQISDTGKVLFEDKFVGNGLGKEWVRAISPRAGTAIESSSKGLSISANENSFAFVERSLPSGAAGVEATISRETAAGYSWGPGVALVFSTGALRINIRPGDNRIGVDFKTSQILGGSLLNDEPNVLRIMLSKDQIRLQSIDDDNIATTVATLPRSEFPGDPIAVRVGRMSVNVDAKDYSDPGSFGECKVESLKVFGRAN